MKKRRNCCYLQCFCAVRSRNHCKYRGFWGSGGQKHCNLQCFLTNVKKHWYLRCFHSHRNIKQRNLRGFWKFLKLAVKHAENRKTTVKTSVSAITKRRKSVRKRVQKLKNPPPGPATCGTAKKDVANQKLRSKSWKTRGFFTFSLPILDGRVHEQVSSVLFFYSVFWRRASRPIKNRRFWPKNGAPPQVNL